MASPRSDRSRMAGEAVELEARRRKARVELLDADLHFKSEITAFDVLVNGALIGRWVRTKSGGSVTWTDGQKVDTGSCDGEPIKIIAAVRNSAPIPPPPPPQGTTTVARRPPRILRHLVEPDADS